MFMPMITIVVIGPAYISSLKPVNLLMLNKNNEMPVYINEN